MAIYPALCLICALGITRTFHYIKNKNAASVFFGVICALFFVQIYILVENTSSYLSYVKELREGDKKRGYYYLHYSCHDCKVKEALSYLYVHVDDSDVISMYYVKIRNYYSTPIFVDG